MFSKNNYHHNKIKFYTNFRSKKGLTTFSPNPFLLFTQNVFFCIIYMYTMHTSLQQMFSGWSLLFFSANIFMYICVYFKVIFPRPDCNLSILLFLVYFLMYTYFRNLGVDQIFFSFDRQYILSNKHVQLQAIKWFRLHNGHQQQYVLCN